MLMLLLEILGTRAGREYGLSKKKSLMTGLVCRANPLACLAVWLPPLLRTG